MPGSNIMSPINFCGSSRAMNSANHSLIPGCWCNHGINVLMPGSRRKLKRNGFESGWESNASTQDIIPGSFINAHPNSDPFLSAKTFARKVANPGLEQKRLIQLAAPGALQILPSAAGKPVLIL